MHDGITPFTPTITRAGLGVLAAALFLVSGCADGIAPTQALNSEGPGAHEHAAVFSNGGEMGELSVQARKDLAALRRLVAPFHDFETAVEAGWDELITPCLEIGIGGMGFHYANLEFFDAEANVLEPEALLFEPQKNGRLRFVGVEYIVPQALSPEPPTLFGQTFTEVITEDGPIWALHVWVGRHNPLGMFADWNPMVSCDHA
jgi:hypothetical protein